MGEGEPQPTISKTELMDRIAQCGTNTDQIVQILRGLGIPFQEYRARGEAVVDSGHRGAPPRELASHATRDNWRGATSSGEKAITTARFNVCNEAIGGAVYDEKKWWIVVLNNRDLSGQDVVAIEEEYFKSLS